MTSTKAAFDKTLDDSRWRAWRARDPEADGAFVFGVATTGIYCRPSCPARAARPDHVAFYATPAEAERAGLRPCKRCRPDGESLAERHAGTVARACRLIEAATTPPRLDALAKAAGLSPSHFQRVFTQATGVTPKAYTAARRAARAANGLHAGDSVTGALYEAGYGAASRFYETAAERLGMTPTAYRNGGAGARIRYATGPCALGTVLVAATDRGVCAILLGDDADALVGDLRGRFSKGTLVAGDPAFAATVAAVVALVAAPRAAFPLPLDIAGTAFQQRVWAALRAIPPGNTATYTAIAAAIGQPEAVRAVAGACGANPVAVAVPCHRVVRADGSLAGYRWGMARKRALLAREAAGEEDGITPPDRA